ncbi:MAG: type II toxin-antitoxin system RelE/ParE family toxin [Actinobacteria bacterium]|nr:type II toxin-antitoxin system RelE/ParE family toxin [Actinomycetota bacterium]
MVVYKLRFKRSVAKDLRTLPRKDLERILRRIRPLASDPRPPGCEKLSGAERYRLRQGVYRIIYTVNDEEICVVVVKIAHRKEAYRG